MTRLIRLLVLAASLACAPAMAQVYPVDDSASQVVGGNVRMKWDSVVPQRGQTSGLTGQFTVIVRLDVSPWVGRNVRIYKTLPPQPNGPLQARWTSRGVLQPGILRDGERTLVYAGTLLTDRLEDTLHITLQADGDRLPDYSQVTFAFEIELESP